MRCQKCSAENPPGAKFCIQCAAPFPRRCPQCAFENPLEARFCAQCATPLVEQPPAATLGTRVPARDHADHSDGALWGERRHLTVLFCDLVGSTEIATRLDPEEWRETAASYHAAASEAISRFGGQVAKYLGDGVMAYFGWPAAHDNDAERAARAGLAIIDALSQLNEQSDSLPLKAGLSHMTEDEKRETIRMHLSLIMQYLLPSYAIALPSQGALAEPQAKRANESARCAG